MNATTKKRSSRTHSTKSKSNELQNSEPTTIESAKNQTNMHGVHESTSIKYASGTKQEAAPKEKRGRKPKPKQVEYEVFHSMGEFFWVALGTTRSCSDDELIEALINGRYDSVFKSDIPKHFPPDVEDQLEQIFYETQNLDKAWNPPRRSTSVGDIIRIGDEFWTVAPVGWRRLELEDWVRGILKLKASS